MPFQNFLYRHKGFLYISIVKFKYKYFILTLCVIALVLFLADDSIAQCSMCRKIATDGANSKAVGKSLNHGILYLLAMPYCLLAFFFRKQIFGFMRGLRSDKKYGVRISSDSK